MADRHAQALDRITASSTRRERRRTLVVDGRASPVPQHEQASGSAPPVHHVTLR